jgi:hypothetical protein
MQQVRSEPRTATRSRVCVSVVSVAHSKAASAQQLCAVGRSQHRPSLALPLGAVAALRLGFDQLGTKVQVNHCRRKRWSHHASVDHHHQVRIAFVPECVKVTSNDDV